MHRALVQLERDKRRNSSLALLFIKRNIMKIQLYGIEIDVEYTYEYISDGDNFHPDTGDTIEIEEITIGGKDAYYFILQAGFFPDIENIILSKETTF